ncbi:probable transcriptional regulatory protein TDE_1487 isoform X2 [Rhopilema esculentum]|uniref:probable transcriptional regulatory protein TDE_1487 isoform X2 n=1 Tax=Rhopilema esculentum TaxID=499914 RepID=UPI0031D717AE
MAWAIAVLAKTSLTRQRQEEHLWKKNGPDPISNSKLDGIISRAKAVKMPKDSIESAIKSGLRVGSEAKVQLSLEIRGPGRCAVLLDVLSSNIKRTRPELNTILKKYGGIQSEEGSVSFMFQRKGIVTAERSNNDDASVNRVEDAAILCGAENFYFDTDEDGNDVIRFVCAPLDFGAVQNSLCSEHGFHVISANDELVAVKLVDLDENQMQQADKLIDQLSSHPDVMRIFDNIRNYPSSTLKRDNPF